MIHRTKPIRRTPVKKRRAGVRRGRVVNREFMEFVRQRKCILARKHNCLFSTTFHHLRTCGSPKDDTWGVGLCWYGHFKAWSENSVEALGKDKFEKRWDISLTEEAQRNRDAWEKHISQSKGTK